ncbi:Azospirillum phage Cd, Gp10 [uncultured Caudovirales phage]|uniref:Azospirillum phage Cd, Gp10 n=1 Tax=uncultured Caudovirales phage TaxID=2100421 RepID=A0A6J5S1B7_9CAUD|nr:Azospirillum phage Cd, Gp10 [uncultured Caudovirales phage]
MAGIGHNSRAHDAEDVLNGAAQGQLKSIIERIERLNQEKDEIGEMIKEVFAEAKGNGFDVKTIRKVLQLRKMDPAKRVELEALVDLYEHALTSVAQVSSKPKAKTPPPPADDEDDYSDIG